MKRISLWMLVCLLGALPANAQLFNGASFLIKNAPEHMSQVSVSVTRQVFAQTRTKLQAPASLLPRLRRSVVQIAIPRYKEEDNVDLPTYASGFLLSAYGKTWVASAYHVLGGEGRQRIVRMPMQDGSEKEVMVKVNVDGISGWHEPDLSLAYIDPKEIPEGMEPLEIAEPNLKEPAYSAGYVAGPFSLEDILPVKRELTSLEGINLYGKYHIEGSTKEHPITGSGQCGSPIVQQLPGSEEWRVVGLHNGHCLDLDEPALSRGSGVNLALAVPYLLSPLFDESQQIASHVLSFRGFEVGRLDQKERVSEVAIVRNGQIIWKQKLQQFPHPYSDAHAELAFATQDVHRADELIFTISSRQTNPPLRTERTISFTVP